MLVEWHERFLIPNTVIPGSSLLLSLAACTTATPELLGTMEYLIDSSLAMPMWEVFSEGHLMIGTCQRCGTGASGVADRVTL